MHKTLFLNHFLQESISTCRFAQRVALIKNEAILNEELDPALVRQHQHFINLSSATQSCNRHMV